MASTKSQSKPSSNGRGTHVSAAVKDAGDTAATAARQVRGPMLAAGAAAAGLLGGWAAGSRRKSGRGGLGALVTPRRRVLGVPVGRKSAALRTAELLRDGAKHLNSATSQVSGTTDDVRQIREELERVNRKSPLEVVLDGLTHRRGAHKNEG